MKAVFAEEDEIANSLSLLVGSFIEPFGEIAGGRRFVESDWKEVLLIVFEGGVFFTGLG